MTTVREALPEEAEAVAALINAINSLDGNTPAVPMTAAIVRRDLMGANPRAWLLVAAEPGGLVGFATVGIIYDAERAAPCAMLLDLYVTPGARRRGHARALMAALAARGQAEGVGCLWWGVDDGDDEAMAFYRAIGARSEGGFTGLLLDGAALHRLANEAPQ